MTVWCLLLLSVVFAVRRLRKLCKTVVLREFTFETDTRARGKQCGAVGGEESASSSGRLQAGSCAAKRPLERCCFCCCFCFFCRHRRRWLAWDTAHLLAGSRPADLLRRGCPAMRMLRQRVAGAAPCARWPLAPKQRDDQTGVCEDDGVAAAAALTAIWGQAWLAAPSAAWRLQIQTQLTSL